MISRSSARALLCAGLLAFAAPASAFKLNLDLNKVGGLLKSATDLGGMSEEDEIDLGRNMAAKLMGAAPLLPDEKVQRYVNQVGTWIAAHSERKNLKWHFGVLDTPSVNAFAVPGGYVFVTKGLLLRLRSEAELAGVLAHEIVHVLDHHHLKAVQKSGGLGLVTGLASLAADQHRHGDAINKALDATSEIYKRGLDKDDEYAADVKGAVLAARAGYDPYALLGVLKTLEAIDPQDSDLALMFKTHPSPTARLDRLAPAVEDYLASYSAQPQVAARFTEMRKRLK